MVRIPEGSTAFRCALSPLEAGTKRRIPLYSALCGREVRFVLFGFPLSEYYLQIVTDTGALPRKSQTMSIGRDGLRYGKKGRVLNKEARQVGKGRRTNETPGTIGRVSGACILEIPGVQGSMRLFNPRFGLVGGTCHSVCVGGVDREVTF